VLSLLDLVPWATTLIVLAVVLLPQMVRVLREYERGVIFRLGRLIGPKGPGLIFLIPFVDRMRRCAHAARAQREQEARRVEAGDHKVSRSHAERRNQSRTRERAHDPR